MSEQSQPRFMRPTVASIEKQTDKNIVKPSQSDRSTTRSRTCSRFTYLAGFQTLPGVVNYTKRHSNSSSPNKEDESAYGEYGSCRTKQEKDTTIPKTPLMGLDDVQLQANQALAEVARLLNPPKDAVGDSQEENKNILRELTLTDMGKIDQKEFEALIQSVIKDAIEQIKSNAAQRQQDQRVPLTASQTSAATELLAQEIERIRHAGAGMMNSMEDIIAEIRKVMLDSKWLDEHMAKFQSQKLDGSKEEVSDEGTPSHQQPGVEDYATKTRVQHLKEQLIKNGLRDYLITSTQPQENEITAAMLLGQERVEEARKIIKDSLVTANLPAMWRKKSESSSSASNAPQSSSVASSLSLHELMKMELAKALQELDKEQVVILRPKVDRVDVSDSSSSESESEHEDNSTNPNSNRSSRRHSLPSFHGVARASSQEDPHAAERLALELQRLQFERDKLAWESEKLRTQQQQYADLLAKNQVSASAGQVEQQRLEFERLKFALEQQMSLEKDKLDNTRVGLQAHLKDLERHKSVPLPKGRRSKSTTIVIQQPTAGSASATSSRHGSRRSSRDTSPSANLEGYISRRRSLNDKEAMAAALEAYVLKRDAKKRRKHRKHEKNEKKEKDEYAKYNLTRSRSASRERQPSLHNLNSAVVVGSVTTTPKDPLSLLHHRLRSTSISNLGIQPPVEDAISMKEHQLPCTSPQIIHKQSSRNLLSKWTPAELTATIPLRLFPTQDDIDSLPSEEERAKTWKLLQKYQPYDKLYRKYLDPTNEATNLTMAKRLYHEEDYDDLYGSSTSSSSTSPSEKNMIITPTLYLSLHLALTNLHKISFLHGCRPCIEIYTIRSARTQLIYESEIAPKECTTFHPKPILLRLDDVCHGQLERDILIRVVHCPTQSLSMIESPTCPRVLLGEHYTNLYQLQSGLPFAQFPLLRAHAKEKDGLKEKGTLVIQKQDLFIRTSYGLLHYHHMNHPNRVVPVTFPPAFERKTSCTINLTVSCSHLHLLESAKRSGKKILNQSGKLVPYLEFYRLQEDGQWSKQTAYKTEVLLLNLTEPVRSLEDWDSDDEDRPSHRGSTASKSSSSSSSTLNTWKPIEMPLFDLCFGDITRQILVKVYASGMTNQSKTLLSSFQVSLLEVLGKQEPSVVVLDAHFARPEAGLDARSPRCGGGVHHHALGELVSPTAQRTLGSAKPACITFQRCHVYSSLTDLQQLVQQAGLRGAEAEEGKEASEGPCIISGVHQIILDQEKRKAGGEDQSERLNFLGASRVIGSAPIVAIPPTSSSSLDVARGSGIHSAITPAAMTFCPLSMISPSKSQQEVPLNIPSRRQCTVYAPSAAEPIVLSPTVELGNSSDSSSSATPFQSSASPEVIVKDEQATVKVEDVVMNECIPDDISCLGHMRRTRKISADNVIEVKPMKAN